MSRRPGTNRASPSSYTVMGLDRQTSRAMVIAVALALLLASCGNDATVSTGGSTTDQTGRSTTVDPGSPADTPSPAGELAFGLQRCDPDSPRLTADPSFYRDEPIYVGNEQPTEQVRAWAEAKPGFEDLWIDRDHNGWISLGFSEEVAARQAELEAEFPDIGVVAVEVTATDAELQALRSEVEAALDGLSSWGLGHSVSRGQVEASVPVLDEETLSRFAHLAGPTLCLSGADPADAVIDGPQPTEGDGWRLLGTDRTGMSYRTGVATTSDQARDLWAEAGLDGEPPAVDFDREIVIWFGAVYGSGCPLRMDDVVVDTERRVVHGLFVLPGNPTSCNSDANPEAYVVALGRDRLPEAPFDVQLDADDPPGGAPEERTTVTVDLRPAGAIATAEDLVVETLDDAGPPRPDRFAPGEVIEDGFPSTLLLDLDCSVDVIGPLNGTMWRADDPELVDGPPTEWTIDANDGLAEAEFQLSTGPARLTITVNGRAESYTPLPSGADADMSCT